MERVTTVADRNRLGQFATINTQAREALLEELNVAPEKTVTQKTELAKDKLAIAREFSGQMTHDLRILCQGLEERLSQIGYRVSDAYRFQGAERFYLWLGQTLGVKRALNAAHEKRLMRIDQLDAQALVKEIAAMVVTTIEELGIVEEAYRSDVESYDKIIGKVITKLDKAQPDLIETQAKRQRIEGETNALKLELEIVSPAERAAKEKEYDAKKQELDSLTKKEAELLEIVNHAQKAIPILQQNRDSSQSAETAVRQMRRGLLEKQENLGTVLKNSMTHVKAQARLEMFRDIDPAFNKTVEMLTEHGIKVAGAAMDIAMKRASKSAIDPDKFNVLARDLSVDITNFMDGIARLETEAKEGARAPRTPLPPGSENDNGDAINAV